MSSEPAMPGGAWLDAQNGVLGALLIDAPHVAGMVMHRLGEDDFTGAPRTVFAACRRLFLTGQPIDAVTVANALPPQYRSMLLELMETTPTAAHVGAYMDLVQEQARLTRLRELGEELRNAATLEDARGVMDRANRLAGQRPGVRVVTMEQGYLDFYQRQGEPAKLVPWGLPRLNDTLRTERGDFVVLGGYASAGKTAFALQLAWEQARDRRVGIFSLETRPEKLIDRTVSAVTGVDFGRIKAHALREEDWAVCEKATETLLGRRLELIQSGGMSVTDIQALALAGRYEVIYIDYLQLIAPDDRRRSAVDQVTQISMDLHTMAQTTGMTVVALSQLSRPEKGGGEEKAPGLHSLRQSGQIEQDADGVMLLYKERPDDPRSRRVLKIAKNKEGEAGGLLYLDFDGSRQRFAPSDGTKAVAAQMSDAGRQAKNKNRTQKRDPDAPVMEQLPMREVTERDPDMPF